MDFDTPGTAVGASSQCWTAFQKLHHSGMSHVDSADCLPSVLLCYSWRERIHCLLLQRFAELWDTGSRKLCRRACGRLCRY